MLLFSTNLSKTYEKENWELTCKLGELRWSALLGFEKEGKRRAQQEKMRRLLPSKALLNFRLGNVQENHCYLSHSGWERSRGICGYCALQALTYHGSSILSNN